VDKNLFKEFSKTHTAEETAKEFSVSIGYVYALAKQEDVKFVTKRSIRLEEIKNYVAENYKTKGVTEMAKEMSCSKPCISHICKVLGIKPVRKFRSKQICERDEMIKKLVSEGYTYENVGKAMGITRQRIEQIINKKKN